MATRKELTEALGDRYQKASRNEKTAILDEFTALTKWHRKHAIRVLNSSPAMDSSPRIVNSLALGSIRLSSLSPVLPPSR